MKDENSETILINYKIKSKLVIVNLSFVKENVLVLERTLCIN